MFFVRHRSQVILQVWLVDQVCLACAQTQRECTMYICVLLFIEREGVCLTSFFSLSVWFEPTCLDKAGKAIDTGTIDTFTFISPNMAELREINRFLTASKSTARIPPRKPTFETNRRKAVCIM